MVAEIEEPVSLSDRERRAPQPLGAEDGLYGVYFILNQIREEQEAAAKLMAEHKREVNRTLRGDDNGEKGLSWRMLAMEREVLAMRTQTDRIENALNARGIETEKGRWGSVNTFILAFFSLLTAIVTAVITTLLARGGKP